MRLTKQQKESWRRVHAVLVTNFAGMSQIGRDEADLWTLQWTADPARRVNRQIQFDHKFGAYTTLDDLLAAAEQEYVKTPEEQQS